MCLALETWLNSLHVQHCDRKCAVGRLALWEYLQGIFFRQEEYREVAPCFCLNLLVVKGDLSDNLDRSTVFILILRNGDLGW